MGQIIYREYIVFRGSNISCSLATVLNFATVGTVHSLTLSSTFRSYIVQFRQFSSFPGQCRAGIPRDVTAYNLSVCPDPRLGLTGCLVIWKVPQITEGRI